MKDNPRWRSTAKGVCLYRDKWRVRLYCFGAEVYLGVFNNAAAARKAYDMALALRHKTRGITDPEEQAKIVRVIRQAARRAGRGSQP